MRTYVAVTGSIFAALALAHGARLAAEGTGPLGEPVFVATSVASVAVAAWAALLLRGPRGR